MKWAVWGVNQNVKWYPRWNKEKCWELTVENTSQLQTWLKKALKAVEPPTSRILRTRSTMEYVITSDASKQGWGSHLQEQGVKHQTFAQIGRPCTSPTKKLWQVHPRLDEVTAATTSDSNEGDEYMND